MKTEWQARRDVVDVCAAMYHKGFLAATDGNVSVRLGDRLVITPTGVSKGRLRPEDLIVTDLLRACAVEPERKRRCGRQTGDVLSPRLHCRIHSRRLKLMAACYRTCYRTGPMV